MTAPEEQHPVVLLVHPGTPIALIHTVELHGTVVAAGSGVVVALDPGVAPPRPGEPVRVRVGVAGEGGRIADGSVIGVDHHAGGAVVRVRVQTGVERRQERRHVRTPTFDLELSVRDHVDLESTGPWHAAAGFDVSGGGIRFGTAERLPVGGIIDLRVHLPGSSATTVEAMARVVWGREEDHPSEPQRRHQYAAAFLGLAPAVEDAVVAWVLERERSHPR